MTTTPATIDVTAVEPTAVTIPTRQLRAGMTTWTVMGQPDTITKVTHFTHGVRTYRADGTVEWFDYQHPLHGTDQTIAVGIPA